MQKMLSRGNLCPEYQSKPAPHFNPDRIVITKGAFQNKEQHDLIRAICSVYPRARVLEKLNVPHNRVCFDSPDSLAQHYQGKRTLVVGIHKSALRYSEEVGNTCPNYWHFSPYGFCPYDCRYCYLAGTPGIKYSPTVKIFLDISQILHHIDRVASQLTEPAAFYLGKLQDALALDPLTGYSRIMVPFFARSKSARLILLTKSANVENLLDLDHQSHTILSWSLNPSEICGAFEKNVPCLNERIAAMRQCAEAGYPLRAVIMPIIPVKDWQNVYANFLKSFLMSVPLKRITLGQICIYPSALQLAELKLGKDNLVSGQLEKTKSIDGRFRFPFKLRTEIYGCLTKLIREFQPQLQIGLCLEEYRTFEALDMKPAIGCCNCVL